MKFKQLSIIAISLISASVFAHTPRINVNDLSPNSSWEDIQSAYNSEIKGTWVKVGNLNSSVFFVEEKNDKLFTKKPTKDGYWKNTRKGGDNDRTEFVETGESIKSGPVTIPIAQYEYKRINSESGEQIKTGYKDYTQPLTRMLDVYAVNFTGNNDNRKERYLFSKEYTIHTKE